MACLQVYFGGELDREVPLNGRVTTIGRDAGCDICIDNPGVSELHARVRFIHDAYVLEDARSRNGVFLNGQKVVQQALEFGDEIGILKHRLTFVEEAVGDGPASPRAASHDAIQQDQTIAVDVATLRQTLEAQQSQGPALLLRGSDDVRQDFPIRKSSFKIGKAGDCDLYLPGFMTPGAAAHIQRRQDGYYIAPGRRGRVRVNGMPTKSPCKLADGDGLRIRHMKMIFRERVPA